MVKKRRGWTMVELMVTVSVLGALALVVTPLMVQSSRFFLLTRARTEIQRDARVSLDTINRFLRYGQASSVIIDQYAGQPSHSRISFTTETGRNMTFYQMNNNLYIVSGATSTLSENLRFIAFSYPRSDDPTIISVSMTMERATYEGRRKALELSIEKVRVMN